MLEEELEDLDVAEGGCFDEEWCLQPQQQESVLRTGEICLELKAGLWVEAVLQEELYCFDSTKVDRFLQK